MLADGLSYFQVQSIRVRHSTCSLPSLSWGANRSTFSYPMVPAQGKCAIYKKKCVIPVIPRPIRTGGERDNFNAGWWQVRIRTCSCFEQLATWHSSESFAIPHHHTNRVRNLDASLVLQAGDGMVDLVRGAGSMAWFMLFVLAIFS